MLVLDISIFNASARLNGETKKKRSWRQQWLHSSIETKPRIVMEVGGRWTRRWRRQVDKKTAVVWHRSRRGEEGSGGDVVGAAKVGRTGAREEQEGQTNRKTRRRGFKDSAQDWSLERMLHHKYEYRQHE